MVKSTEFLQARYLILAQLGISSEILSQAQISPLEKSHCRAVLNWLQNYQPASDASNLEKVRGYLEAFHHLLELEAWEAAKHVAFARPQEKPEIRLAWQLGSWGYYQEQQELHLKLLDKVDAATNATCLNSLGLVVSQ